MADNDTNREGFHMSKKNDKTEAPAPMDPSVREESVGTPAVNASRPCWAAKTLVAEVNALFPETPVEYSNPDGRNTMLDVMFDLTTLDPNDVYDLTTLLNLLDDPAYNVDPRIDSVIAGGQQHAGQVLVAFKSNPRTQDSRDPFGLADALEVLAERDEAELVMFAHGTEPLAVYEGGSL
jgi:hypothetical protein